MHVEDSNSHQPAVPTPLSTPKPPPPPASYEPLTAPTLAEDRLDILDTLRGFALFGILVMNIPLMAMPMMSPSHWMPATPLDEAAATFTGFLFAGKFYILFSFLFGYGLAMQLIRAQARGDHRIRRRYFRRIAGLLVLGLLHATLFFFGDILVTYALLGIVLWFVRRWSYTWLLVGFGLMLAMAALGYALLGAMLGVPPTAEGDEMVQRWVEQAEQGYLGSFADTVRQRLFDLMFVVPLMVLFNWGGAMAFFLLGLCAGKAQVFARPEHLWAKLRPWLWLALPLGLAANAGYVLLLTPDSILRSAAGMGMLAIGGPALTLCYVAFWLHAHDSPHLTWLTRPLRAAGRVSLSHYLAQSVVCGFVFNGYGLGLYNELGQAACLGLAVLIFTGLTIMAVLWLRYFQYGPMEWLLRSWTYWRLQPLRRPAQFATPA